jgi:putative transcriptional regulator
MLAALCLYVSAAAAELTPTPAPGTLLVASTQLEDPNFKHSVVLLLRADHHGAMGLIINRPMPDSPVAELPDGPRVEQLQGLTGYASLLHQGGPMVMQHMLAIVRSSRPLERAWEVLDDVYVTPDVSQLDRTRGFTADESSFRAYVGYAGWGPGQLEAEIASGGWHLTEASAEHIFSTEPEKLWSKLLPPVKPRFVRVDQAHCPLTAQVTGAHPVLRKKDISMQFSNL